MPFLTLAKLTEILAAQPGKVSADTSSSEILGISTDTRSLKPGELFVALRGEKFDGHQFLEQAIAKGAIAAIVDTGYSVVDPPLPLLVVEDTLAAYQAIARWWRDQFQIPIIAVTGSVGKTTTKELIAAVLGTQGKVLKTQLNYNNEIGVPKTLLELTADHDYAVIEMAMRGAGQIALLAQIARPTIAMITNVGTAHIGLLGSEDAIARAKCELLAESPADAIAVLNYDNQRLMNTAATVWSGTTITYGFTGGDVCGELINSDTLTVNGMQFPLPLAGRHNALNYLGALSVAKALNVSWEPLQQGLQVLMPEGRAQRYQLNNDIVILDESYNAGLESMLAALELLSQTPGKRRIAVLGTMKELGERSLEFHQQVGEKAKQLNLDGLFILADPAEAQAIATGASGLPVIEMESSLDSHPHQALAARLQAFVKPGDRILFKASHSVQLFKVLEQFRNRLSAEQ